MPRDKTMTRLNHLLSISLIGAMACSPNSNPQSSDCPGGKCDTPGERADRECEEECGADDDCFLACREEAAFEVCELRRGEALSGDRHGFLREFIRWPCRDADGVNTEFKDDRGQDYCEYFAVVQLPPESAGGSLPAVADIGRLLNRMGETSEQDVELTPNQENVLKAQDPDSVVGQCVFTSWFDDTPGPLPSCQAGSCPSLAIPTGRRPDYLRFNSLRFPLLTSFFRMKFEVNGIFAAVDLIDACTTPVEAFDPEDMSDPLNDPYTRGCINTFDNFGTEARRSDPAICASIGRLTECGCGLDTDGDPRTLEIVPEDMAPVEIMLDENGDEMEVQFKALSRHLIPKPTEDKVALRGFPLGTWLPDGTTPGAKRLPPGCRFMETGDEPESQVIVSCDLTAEHVLDTLEDGKDLKGACGEIYGDDVVVHVPLDVDNIHCFIDPDATYAASCGPTPWRIGTEPTAGSCENRCNQFNAAASCQCNAACEQTGDCCSDFQALCR